MRGLELMPQPTVFVNNERVKQIRLSADLLMVGLVGLEPTTLCSQSRCASQLRYSPMSPSILDEIIKKEKTPIQYVGSGSE